MFSLTLHLTLITHSTLQKAKRMRTGFAAFQEQYGAENTIGVEDIVLTDYQSSEYSCNEGGDASDGEWNAAKDAARAAEDGLEVWRLRWRSQKVRTLPFA
jgi:hypothetical protein